ncbi:uncharacterized protein LOC143022660 [Oratosquilla oratoria]|uniref:uncharacterized protein LOC143022660 n=1 Tax=Oratosquilla oratoria TaxID=337810 RepID=UPI003F76F810
MLKNSSEFLEKMRDIRVASDKVMVSFDVKSMFTSLPNDLVKRARHGVPPENWDHHGWSISVILAEITMQRFENEILSAAPTSLKLWTRYVDDVFAILKDRDVDGFLEQLNGKHEAIQFEMEKEAEGELPFLDVMVKRVGDILVTSVYRKATHTNRLLDFGSDHPICHKKSVVKTLWNRVERVCSTKASLKEERRRLRRVFRPNGYPNQVVKRWTAPH